MRVLPLAIMSMLAFGGETVLERRGVFGGMSRGGWKRGHEGQFQKALRKRRSRNLVARAERRRQRRAARA